MKKLRVLIHIFLGIGGLMLLGALLLWNNTRRFIANADTAQGQVIELIEVRDQDDGSISYKPVVTYEAANGRSITFTASFSSKPAPYDVGESVEVLYAPHDPHDARIKGFSSLWLGPTILGGLGMVFAGVGGGMLLARRGGKRKKRYLMAYGNAIQTELQGVDRNTSLEVNGKNPWRITSQWLDPASNKLRVFHSENLWFDPTQFVKAKTLTVLLDPKDPKRYHMDVSFLPELDESQ
ncbi:MAG TPA: DUF3592 domain-containing protein [Steroidobacteraceae bacterium]|nr:DUF3592 domain-containing protein [Steroidobacteraceae bacterium]